jgi:hypothetical protein
MRVPGKAGQPILIPTARHPKPRPTRHCRWLVISGGYAAFDSSPPAKMIVATPAKMIVAHYVADSVEKRDVNLALRDEF